MDNENRKVAPRMYLMWFEPSASFDQSLATGAIGMFAFGNVTDAVYVCTLHSLMGEPCPCCSAYTL